MRNAEPIAAAASQHELGQLRRTGGTMGMSPAGFTAHDGHQTAGQAAGQTAYDVPRGSPPTSPPPAPRVAEVHDDDGAGVIANGAGTAPADAAGDMELTRLKRQRCVSPPSLEHRAPYDHKPPR